MTTYADVKPAQITPHPKNPRADVGDVTELAASITAQGILEPLIVCPDDTAKTKTPKYLLLAGHRRLAAARVAGVTTVPCVIRADLTDPAAQLEAMLVENLQRTDLTPVEEGDAYQALLTYPGYTVTRIAKATGRAAKTVKQRSAVAGLSEQVRGAVSSGQVTIADAAALVEFAGDPDTLRQLEASLASGASQFRWRVERAREDRKRAKQAEALADELRRSGTPVLTDEEYLAEQTWQLDDLGVRVEEHVECPGHAAVVVSTWQGPETVWVCADVPAHHPDLVDEDNEPTAAAGPARPRESAQDLADREADEQRRRDLAAAATVRRQHLADVVRGGDEATATTVLRADVTERVLRFWQREYAADVLGLNTLVGTMERADRGDTKATDDDLSAAVAKLNLPQLVLLGDVLGGAQADGWLLSPEGWGVDLLSWQVPRDGSLPGDAYRAHLTGVYGYEWTPAEQDALDVAARQRAERNAQDAQDGAA